MYSASSTHSPRKTVPHPQHVDALIFDLDGTLVDSLPDITAAINEALRSERAEPMSLEGVKQRLGRGAASILAPALNESDPHAERVERAARVFVAYYRTHLVRHTQPREGVTQVLAHFASTAKYVISNKPDPLPQEVLEALGLAHYFEAIFGGTSFPRKKPDPMPINYLLERHPWDKTRTVMVGDSPIDVQAAKAAGVVSCAVLGGYAPPEALEAASPDYLLPDIPSLMTHFAPRR